MALIYTYILNLTKFYDMTEYSSIKSNLAAASIVNRWLNQAIYVGMWPL